ncbi:MAG: hypothetical protein V4635_17435 [Bacteroidota bacterium]
MKKMLFIVAVAALFTTSCSKDRVCTCKDTSGDEDKVTLVKVTKGQAKANCVSTKYDDGNGNTYTNTCELD